jgi:transposase
MERLNSGRQVASYLGPVPGESSGDRQRLGHISRHGNTLLHFLMVEAAQATVSGNPECRCQYPIWRCDEEERLTELEIDLMLKPMN